MRFNRFVFLNRPMLSLGTHLGVTTSPQAPFPTDYVTWSVSDQSPPLRLTPSRSRGRSCSATSTSASLNMHSRHAQATRPPYRRASLARRTVGVSSPGESHPQALAEPDVNLSAHPAPIIEPQLQDRLANAQR